MNIVYILIAIVYNGHSDNSIVPTMEFSTREKCEAAIVAFKEETDDKRGHARFRCVRIEK